jgi:iron complex outermembrane receptor protein
VERPQAKPYSLWDLTASYRFTPELRLRVGVLNVADTAPPFTNQSRYFPVTYDQTYDDTCGRTSFASLSYEFR